MSGVVANLRFVIRCSKTFGIRSVHTVQNYISFLEQAYLLVPLHKFSFKPKIRIRETKLYAIDVGFVSYASDIAATGSDRGWRMENIVFLELHRRRRAGGFELYYYKTNYEIDFVLFKSGKIVQLIQVSYDATEEKTRKRELSALVKGAADLQCDNLLLITQIEEGSIETDEKEVKIVPITKWLLDREVASGESLATSHSNWLKNVRAGTTTGDVLPKQLASTNGKSITT